MAKKNIATFLGPQLGISYMGSDTWGGWSGLKQPNNNTVEAFNFHSPNKGLIVDMGWFINFDDVSSSKALELSVSLNGTTVILVRGEMTGNADYPDSFPFVIPSFIIPPESEVIVEVGTDETSAVANYVTLVGKQI